MATGGEVPGQNPGRTESEDLDNLKCLPCLEDGHLHEAVGMCVDCDDHLCEQCFKIHILPKPMRNHKLLDIEDMRQGQIRATTRDMCTEKCRVHTNEITKYYCTTHRRLGCTVCVTLTHKTCEETSIHYIPHVAESLANNEEYVQSENNLKSALETFKTVFENITRNSEELETSCSKALKCIKEFRKSIEEALKKIETELIEKVEAIKSEEMTELAAIRDKYKAVQEELQAAWKKNEALINSQQNCGAYINMMKTHERLTAMDSLIDQAIGDVSYQIRPIDFVPNRDTLEMLKIPNTLGTVSGASRRIERLNNARDLTVKLGTDRSSCWITGLVILPGDELVLTDRKNKNIKTVSLQSNKVLSHLELSSEPWDVTAISSNKIAVTLPYKKKVAIITVADNAMSIDKTLDVDGDCRGVDYKNDKLAVSFVGTGKVQILSLQGSVIHTQSVDKLGNRLFYSPYYLTYGKDDSTLYVSNCLGRNVVCVKLDGTVIARYTENELKTGPYQPAMDNNGDVLVCAGDSSPYAIHHITNDCEKLQVLLSEADGLGNPHSICFNAKKDRVYVGMYQSDIVKVYNVVRG